jgi:hypothetical protein
MNLKMKANKSRQRYRRDAAQTLGGYVPEFDRVNLISFLLYIPIHGKQLIRFVNTSGAISCGFTAAEWRYNHARANKQSINCPF